MQLMECAPLMSCNFENQFCPISPLSAKSPKHLVSFHTVTVADLARTNNYSQL